MVRLLATLVMVAALGACSPEQGPPDIALDRTACAHCGMLVSDLRFAAAIRVRPNEAAQVFDDIGCMLRAWHEAGDTSEALAWAMDVDDSWVPAPEATFVSGSITTPMGGGIVAFRDRDAAASYAAGVQGAELVSFSDLLATAGPSPSQGGR